LSAVPQLGLFGRGRLGSAIAQAAGPALLWQVGREAPPAERVAVAIEASAAAAVPARLEWALATGTPLVIGSTGWELPELEQRVGTRIGVVVAPNFSLAVLLLARLALVLGRFAALDERCDPYLVEHHHARKHDAPSGTARLLARQLIAGCPRKTEWAQGGPLAPHQLSVAAVRAGSTYSEHRVGLDAPAEVLELRHEARSPAAFAQGALAAARWIAGRKGVYGMDAVAAELLDPLFQAAPRAPSAPGARPA
jgi:4-hydroxy-tetrahydrodipicolinate reductase